MRRTTTLVSAVVLGLVLTMATHLVLAQDSGPQSALDTAFTYQGRLSDAVGPVDGTCDFVFKLYDAAEEGTELGVQRVPNVGVSEGMFTVRLDFGAGAFTGQARWLQIDVDCGGGATTLSPRQELTAAPYALWAADGPFVGAGVRNTVTGGHATVGGGRDNEASGWNATVGGGDNNEASDEYSTVGGGSQNKASQLDATVAGGSHNEASGPRSSVGRGYGNVASGEYATVGGGVSNTASGPRNTVGGGIGNIASVVDSTVGGGYENTASGVAGTVGGGSENTVSSDYATVGGGWNNTASQGHATVGGGNSNTASGQSATVGGGASNGASGWGATVPGGVSNLAQGEYSFAAGLRARANNDGCFVWGGAVNSYLTCSTDNQTLFRSFGGFSIMTAETKGVYLAAGGSSWNAHSDRKAKENFQPLDRQGLLEDLATLEIATWNYISQDPAIRHIGPMAQDFNALLPDLGGEGSEYINAMDADGVALAAIQGLHQALVEKDQQIAVQKERIDSLEARLAALEALVSARAQDTTGGGQ